MRISDWSSDVCSSDLADIIDIDAILWTHDHADHCHGIDDVRQIFHHRGKPVPGYARRETLAHLRRRFGYVFDGRDGYPATIEGDVFADAMLVGDIRIKTVAQPHGNLFYIGQEYCRARVCQYVYISVVELTLKN